MSSTVHDLYKAIVVILLCSDIYGLQINHKDAVNDELLRNHENIEIHEVLGSLKSNENDFEVIPEVVTNVSFLTEEAKRNQNEHLEDEIIGVIIGETDDEVKQRMRRQAAHGYSPLYPQLPSGPPYNSYQPQPNNNPYGQNPYQPHPNNNPYGQNPYQQQPSFNPSGQNTNQQQSSFNPYGVNQNQQQPSFNPYGVNQNQQQPSFNPYGVNQNQQQPSYNYSGPSPYTQRPQQWNPNSYNSSQSGYPVQNYNPNTGYHNTNQGPYNPYSPPGNSYRPPNGQHPLQNQTFNSLPHASSFRPPNGTTFTTPWPSYNPQIGTNFRNTSYPGQPPLSSNYPPSSGNKYPFQVLNSTSQRPPYFNPNQYPSYNSSGPNPSQWPSSTNSQYPNYPGARPSSAYNPYMSQGSHNATWPHGSPYHPGSNGQYPSNVTFNPNYPTPNSYNPSIPNYSLQNNQAQTYDPRRVPPQNFSYH